MSKLFLLLAVFAVSLCGIGSAQSFPPACPGALDYIDSTYGGMVRQTYKSDGHEHNLYHYRNPWNANNTRMLGIRENLANGNWRVTLFDGDGCFINELYPITQYGWQVVWDRIDPAFFYVMNASRLYRYYADTGVATLAKDFAALGMTVLQPPTLNGPGDRILTITTGNVFRTYQLPGMTNERTFTVPDLAPGCDMRHVRYIGYQNYIAVACRNAGTWGTRIYNDTGVLLHQFPFSLGHDDFSPDGKWAYFTITSNNTVAIHLVNIDGTNDQTLYTAQGKFQNLHITWPRAVNDWFVVSFFPSSLASPPFTIPFDEILMLHTNGTQEWLARTRTTDAPGESFWAQAQANVSSDGSRIGFNSDCFNDAPGVDCTDSATVDQYIVYTDVAPPPANLPPVAEANGPYSGIQNVAISFSSAGSNDPDGTIASYSWNFGDGTALSTSPNPSHTYTSAGNFTATLTVTDNQGATDPDTAPVTVAPPQSPDLVETTITNPPGSVRRGGNFSVTDTAKNQGTATAGASTTRRYLSLDTLKNGGDTLLNGSRAVPSLAPAAQSNGAANANVPTATPLGTYYLLACADDMLVVAESNETNNCKASTTTVTVTP